VLLAAPAALHELVQTYKERLTYGSAPDVTLRLTSMTNQFLDLEMTEEAFSRLTIPRETGYWTKGALWYRPNGVFAMLQTPVMMQSAVNFRANVDVMRSLAGFEAGVGMLESWARTFKSGVGVTKKKMRDGATLDDAAAAALDRLPLSFMVPPPPLAARAALVGAVHLFASARLLCFTGSHVDAWRAELALTSFEPKAPPPALDVAIPEAVEGHPDAVLEEPWFQLFAHPKGTKKSTIAKVLTSRPIDTSAVVKGREALTPVHALLHDAGARVTEGVSKLLEGLEEADLLLPMLEGYVEDLLSAAVPEGAAGAPKLLAAPAALLAGQRSGEAAASRAHTRGLLLSALSTFTKSSAWTPLLTNTAAQTRFDEALEYVDLTAGEAGAGGRAEGCDIGQLAIAEASVVLESVKTEGTDGVKGADVSGFYGLSALQRDPLTALVPFVCATYAELANGRVDGWAASFLPKSTASTFPKPATAKASLTSARLTAMTASSKYCLLRALAASKDAFEAMKAQRMAYPLAYELLVEGPGAAIAELSDRLGGFSRGQNTAFKANQKLLNVAGWTPLIMAAVERLVLGLLSSSTASWLVELTEAVQALDEGSPYSMTALASGAKAYADAAFAYLPERTDEECRRQVDAWIKGMQGAAKEVERGPWEVEEGETEEVAVARKRGVYARKGFLAFQNAIEQDKLPAKPRTVPALTDAFASLDLFGSLKKKGAPAAVGWEFSQEEWDDFNMADSLRRAEIIEQSGLSRREFMERMRGPSKPSMSAYTAEAGEVHRLGTVLDLEQRKLEENLLKARKEEAPKERAPPAAAEELEGVSADEAAAAAAAAAARYAFEIAKGNSNTEALILQLQRDARTAAAEANAAVVAGGGASGGGPKTDERFVPAAKFKLNTGTRVRDEWSESHMQALVDLVRTWHGGAGIWSELSRLHAKELGYHDKLQIQNKYKNMRKKGLIKEVVYKGVGTRGGRAAYGSLPFLSKVGEGAGRGSSASAGRGGKAGNGAGRANPFSGFGEEEEEEEPLIEGLIEGGGEEEERAGQKRKAGAAEYEGAPMRSAKAPRPADDMDEEY
jgi:hypothetical protein